MEKGHCYGIIGLGRFGMPLAKKLAQEGQDIIGIDQDEERVKELREYSDYAFVCKKITKEVLEEIGIQNCDIVIVCIGSHIETSILTTLHLINLKVPKVIAKATTEEQGEVLEKLGAHVVYPERDMALKIAQKILRRNLVDYISIGKDAEIIEIQMTSGMVGKSIIDMKIREKFHLNIVAIQCMGTTTTEIDPYYQFQNNDTMVAIGKRKSVSDFIDYYS
ncbi:MAG: potassium channel family protein [Longibaculum sp.]